MTYISLISFGCLLVAALFANKHSKHKFGYEFLSVPSVFIAAIAGVCLFWGAKMVNGHVPPGALFSFIPIAIGAAILVFLVIANCRRTSVCYGLGISCLQVPVLIALSGVAVVAIPLYLFSLLGGSGAPSSGKTRFQKDQEWFYDLMNPNGFHKKH